MRTVDDLVKKWDEHGLTTEEKLTEALRELFWAWDQLDIQGERD